MPRIKVRDANRGDVLTEGRCVGLLIPVQNFGDAIHSVLIDEDGSERTSTFYFTDVDEFEIHTEHRFKYSLLIEKVRQ